MKNYTLLPFRVLPSALLLIILCCRPAFAQTPTVQDCLGAIPVCQDTYTQATTYLGAGAYPNEVFNPVTGCENDCPGSCLDGEQNSVWYVFTVQTSGQLRLIIDPFFDQDDYDWAVYDISLLRCTDIYSKYQQMQRSCNAAGNTQVGPTGISTANGGTANCNHCGDVGSSKWNADLPVTAGNTYVLIIENWGTTPQGGYTLDFSASTAVIYDNIRPFLEFVHGEDISCGDASIYFEFSENVTCESVDPTDFILSGPGGPYTILDVQGEVCMLGGDMERNYTLFLNRPISEDGDYSLQLTNMSFVYDACNNFALGNTIIFTVSLGAPVINETGMAINPATCGLSNGSITGIQVTGTPPFTYTWTDEDGIVLTHNLDLLNVPTGNYYFEVDDPNTCQASSGPYYVDQTGAPQLNASAMVITDAHFGFNDGSITGIEVTGTEPLTYQWTDESNNVMGTTLDLFNMYTGNYFILVTDAYGCDTLAGAYTIGQIGGPISVQAAAHPPVVCVGEPAQLVATGFGGNPPYTFSWTSNPPGFTSDIQSPTVYPLVPTVYTVLISDPYNNYSQATATVNVHPLPLSNAGTDVTIPFGTSITLYGNASGGSGNYAYSWEPAAQLINPDAQNPATRNLYATTLFKLTVTDTETECIGAKDTVIVNLSGGALGVTLEAQKDSICIGEPTVLYALGWGGNEPDYTFTWYYNDQEIKVEQGPSSSLQITGFTAGPHEYEVKIWDGFNDVTMTVTVEVMESPFFNLSNGQDIIACPYDSVLLKPSQTYPESTYYWSNGATTPTIKIGTTGIGFDMRSYNLQVTTRQGCQYSDSTRVIFDFAACFGIDEYPSFSSVKIYPNPTLGAFTVDFEDGQGFKELIVLNSMGDAVLKMNLENLPNGPAQVTIDLTRFSSGIYLLQAVNERFIYHQKVIKK
jgi:hypothetical protein